jgi:hypothetical protein
MIASSGTWGSLWLRSSCYSWWLPPPRQLGAAKELRHVLVIVRGRLRWLWVPVKSCKVALVNCSCHWVTSLVGRFLQRPLWWARCVIPISHQTTKCWSTQRGLACQQACEPREKIGCLLPFGILPVIELVLILWLVHSSTRRYNYLAHSITFPQISCSKLFSVISFESLFCLLV